MKVPKNLQIEALDTLIEVADGALKLALLDDMTPDRQSQMVVALAIEIVQALRDELAAAP